MAQWNEFNRINKTRKVHRCAITGDVIPVGSSCWYYIGEYEGDFQSWYCSDKAKKFIDENQELVYGWEGTFECSHVGDLMREMDLGDVSG